MNDKFNTIIYIFVVIMCILFFVMLPSISAESEEYTFPRKSGDHFEFITGWTNTFERTQYRNDVVYSVHSFSVRNINSPIYVQFKKLATDINDCYDNDTWTIELRISDKNGVVDQFYVADERGSKIEINPDVKYTIKMNVRYNHTYMETGRYKAIIQMNVVAKDIDEPYYFFEEIDYEHVVEEQVDDNSFIILLVSFIIICVAILNVLIVRRLKNI